MGVSLQRSSTEHQLKPEAKALLESYMAGAIKEIGYDFKGSARRKAGKYATDFYRSDEAKALTKEDVKAMEKQMSVELKQYGWKEKLDYHINGQARLEAFEDRPLRSMMPVLGIAAVAGAVSIAKITQGFPQDAIPFWATGMGLMLSKGAVMAVSGATVDHSKAEEYANLKHAQLALKQLKREFQKDEYRKEVSNLFAAGYGQPSGGLVQNPVLAAKLKNQGR